MPFYHEDNRTLFSQIKQGEVDFSGEEWNNVSDLAKDLITHLIDINNGLWIKYEDDQPDQLIYQYFYEFIIDFFFLLL